MKKFAVARLHNDQIALLETGGVGGYESVLRFETEEEARDAAMKQAEVWVPTQFAVVRVVWKTEAVVSVSGAAVE